MPVKADSSAISDSALRAALQQPTSAGQVCVECHAEIVRQYATSGMSRSWRAVSPQLAAGIKESPVVSDHVSGYRYVVSAERETVKQIETHAHDPQHRAVRQADFVVGSGNHAIALVNADHGYLTELPVGWFAAARDWRMNPGYELKNQRFSRPVVRGCVACHATSAVHDAPAANHFELPIAAGIDCSRCHGAAERHVAFWKAANVEKPPPEAKLVQPARLSPALANDICLQCHLQGDITVEREGHSPLDFRPGQRLLDQRHDLLIAGQTETLGIASHGARMLQSRCYIASDGQLTCIHCHNAHLPAPALSRESYDAKCASCHKSDACNRPTAASTKGNSTSCIGCHMPQRSTREGIHLVFTDHAIPRLPRAAGSSQPPLLKPDSDVKLVSTWPEEAVDDATLGAAHVILHETMGPQMRSLERACELLANVIHRDPADLDSRYWLGSSWLARGKSTEALAQLREVVSQQPTNYQARFRLALAHEAAGESVAATVEYERLLKDVPYWLEPYPRLAQLYLSQQKPAESVRVLRQQIQQQPSATAYAALALAERLAGATHEQALTMVQQAIELDSRLPEAYVTRGTLWLLARNDTRARADFERVLQLDPSNAVAQQALRSLSGGR